MSGMKKYVFGAALGSLLTLGWYAFAASSMSIVETTKVGYFAVSRVYDKDTNIICYTITGGPSGAGISCLER